MIRFLLCVFLWACGVGCATFIAPLDESRVEGDAGIEIPSMADGGAIVGDGGGERQGDGGETSDGGARDGGMVDGGSVDGGGGDGGARDGGARDGGAADGGTFDGGATDGGAASCPAPATEPAFAIHTNGGAAFATDSARIVLSGSVPARIGGSAVEEIVVNGSPRYVRKGASTWSYDAPLAAGSQRFVVSARAGGRVLASADLATTKALDTTESVPSFATEERFVGSWFFTWFTGDPTWECASAWWPTDRFATWDGSVRWARGQLQDMMDANLDFVGIQYDTRDDAAPYGYRFVNALNVVRATRELLEEGYRPPRLAMFLDTAIANALHRERTGADIDVSTTAGRDTFFEFIRNFHDAARAILGARYQEAAFARYGGRTMLAFWHTAAGSIVGASDAFVRDLKARFQTRYGDTPYVIAHPNAWESFASTDEVTLMFGPSAHAFQGGRDGAGAKTINITPGFWNPISNAHYLAREGGARYAAAWETAQGWRSVARHLYIDSWNETGEGSGIFEAEAFQHAASYSGACDSWVYRHGDAWGPSPRHFIDVTASNAARWNDVPDDDAVIVSHDLPATLRRGERRLATVVVRNAGDRAWSGASGDRLEVLEGAALVAPGFVGIDDASNEVAKFGGVFRGRPVALTFEIVAPCTAGAVAVAFRMRRADGRLFGETLRGVVSVVE
jgi:hypothetical protein